MFDDGLAELEKQGILLVYTENSSLCKDENTEGAYKVDPSAGRYNLKGIYDLPKENVISYDSFRF